MAYPYEKIFARAGKGTIAALGFISSRPVDDTTFLYGDFGGNWLVRLSGSSLDFHRYDHLLRRYVLDEDRSIALPYRIKGGSSLVHLDTIIEEKNRFSILFAILEDDCGQVKAHVIRQVKLLDMLPDAEVQLRNAAGKELPEMFDIAEQLQNSEKSAGVSVVSFKTRIPYGKNMNVVGGNGTLVLHDGKAGIVHVLRFDGGRFMARQHKLGFRSRTPVFEIVAPGAFVAIDGPDVLRMEGDGFVTTDLRRYADAMDLSHVRYVLLKCREGRPSDLFFYSDAGQKGLLLVADPSSEDCGKEFLVSLKSK